MRFINISCHEATRLVSQQLDQPLSLADKLRLQAHLLICKACPSMHQKFATLHQAGQKYATRDEGGNVEGSGLTPESKARIAETLRNAAQIKQGVRD
jgi:predicted anti-sigma-YlaC factor YlaD